MALPIIGAGFGLNPVALGSGIPLFSAATGRVDLDLEDSRMFAGGVALLRYRVQK